MGFPNAYSYVLELLKESGLRAAEALKARLKRIQESGFHQVLSDLLMRYFPTTLDKKLSSAMHRKSDGVNGDNTLFNAIN